MRLTEKQIIYYIVETPNFYISYKEDLNTKEQYALAINKNEIK